MKALNQVFISAEFLVIIEPVESKWQWWDDDFPFDEWSRVSAAIKSFLYRLILKGAERRLRRASGARATWYYLQSAEKCTNGFAWFVSAIIRPQSFVNFPFIPRLYKIGSTAIVRLCQSALEKANGYHLRDILLCKVSADRFWLRSFVLSWLLGRWWGFTSTATEKDRPIPVLVRMWLQSCSTSQTTFWRCAESYQVRRCALVWSLIHVNWLQKQSSFRKNIKSLSKTWIFCSLSYSMR